MTANFKWSVIGLQCYPESEGQTDVVFQVTWLCTATQETNGTLYEANSTAGTNVTLTSGAPYTPYAQLTEQQILGWIWPLVQASVKLQTKTNLEFSESGEALDNAQNREAIESVALVSQAQDSLTLKEKVEAFLQAQINAQINPQVVTPPLPWAPPKA